MSTMQFQFRFMQGGEVQGVFFNAKGSLSQEGLVLAGERLDLACIRDTTTRDETVVLQLWPDSDLTQKLRDSLDKGCLVLKVAGGDALRLERNVDRLASAAAAERHRLLLEAEGRGHLFRHEPCPHCGAILDLTEVPEARYVYCRFCESLLDGATMALCTCGETHRSCDECGMFDRVQGYSEVYFYFLVVIYGYSSRRRHMCDTCAGRLFWKVLLLNAPFLLGLPSAFTLKGQSLMGRDPALRDLPAANRLALRGRPEEVERRYRQLPDGLAGHPGLLVNAAQAYLKARRSEEAMQRVEQALHSCPNYAPAQRVWNALHGVTRAAATAVPFASAPGPGRAASSPPLAMPAPTRSLVPTWLALPGSPEALAPALPARAARPAAETSLTPVGGGRFISTRSAVVVLLLLLLGGLGVKFVGDARYRAYHSDAVALQQRLEEVESGLRTVILDTEPLMAADAARAQQLRQQAYRDFAARLAAARPHVQEFHDRYGGLDYESRKLLGDSLHYLDRVEEGTRQREGPDLGNLVMATRWLTGAKIVLHPMNERSVDFRSQDVIRDIRLEIEVYTRKAWRHGV